MNKLMNKLPLLAFVLAAFAAVAFTSPSGPEYAQDPVNSSIWYNLTNVSPSSTTYECNEAEVVCTRISPSTSADMVAEGQFVKRGDLPIHIPQ